MRNGQFGMNPLAVGAAFAGGALLMYIADPGRGRRRRAVLRDKMVRAAHVTRDRLGKTARYARGKATGLYQASRGMLRSNHIEDSKLRERVRSTLGRVVSRPHSISVDAHDGVITLGGVLVQSEVQPLIAAVSKVPGVRGVRNELDVRHSRGHEPNGQGRSRQSARALSVMQSNWSPMTRMLGLTVSGALIGVALVRRDLPSLVAGLVGVGLAARSFTNIPASRLVGIGAGRRAVDMQKDININAPLDQVFDFFSNYQNFPHFMSRVRDVRNLGNGRSRWVVAGPAGIQAKWDAVVTCKEPNKVLAWRSVPGSMVENAGIIRFEPNEKGGTRVNIKLSYNPPGGALGHLAAMLFGADAKSELDADLMRVKTMIETGHPAHDAAQPAWL